MLLLAVLSAHLNTTLAQEQPGAGEGYEREELGVNRYTAPSIEGVFEQLDKLKPLPFEKVWREFPSASPARREQKGMIFGGLIADGFLIVEAEKQNRVDELGRILIREARGLGVADRVMRHSASLTELGRKNDWLAVRKELIATQADVERAMVGLRDQKMAHLISLGGWLRGLEISAAAVDAEFSPGRARVLVQPDLVDYFAEEVTTLPPAVAHAAVFEKLRTGIEVIRSALGKAGRADLRPAEVQTILVQARELNLAIRKAD
jgi:hypothetical protein